MQIIHKLILSAIVLMTFNACSSSTSGTTAALSESSVFQEAKQTTGYVWYKKSDVLLSKGKKSGHSEALLRTRFNATAASMLDAAGKVKTDAIFPEGSVVVKELYSSANSLSGYAVMWKAKSDPNAATSGWVWAYLNADGSVKSSAPINSKGSQCIACHAISGHIDNTLMNLDQP